MQMPGACAMILSRLLCVVVLALCGLGCDRTPAAAQPVEPVVQGQTHVYVARGVITAMPSAGDFRAELRIYHEHIPTFRGKGGQVHVNADGVLGMKAMDMPFPSLASGVTLDGLAVGDKVEFELSVAYEPRIEYSVTRLSKLPPETEISFENKAP